MVSIGLPVFNAEAFLEEAVNSILKQTFEDIELLIVDDGSTDNSISIIKSFDDKRIKFFCDGSNLGLPSRLNQISQLASGEYLARMDADDIMHPRRIETQFDILSNNQDIDVIGTNSFSINENGSIVGIRLYFGNNQGIQEVSKFIHPTIMAKTDWFRANPYDERAIRIEDAELWFRTKKDNIFMIIKEPLFYYREFGNSYYKKYFKGFKSVIYVLRKHSFDFNWMVFTIRYFISGIRYYIYNIFGLEDRLILRRNQIIYKS